MAIPVLLILAVLWAAVLVPPVLRSRSENRRGGIGDYTSRLGALTHRRPSPPYSGRRDGLRSPRAVPSQSSSPRSRTEARGGGTTPAQSRRRRVLIVLIGTALVSLGLALLISPLLWVVQIAADVLLAVYLYLLFLLKRHGSLTSGNHYFWDSSPDNRAAVAVAHPRVPERPELAPMPGASRPRRSAAG